MLYFIEYLRALAVVLITNSHFKGVYPTDILSFGGGLGLALFFMISGYLLTNIKSDTGFLRWYGKKAVRMYIPLVLFRIAQLLITGKFSSILRVFIQPFPWFVTGMLILYVIYFLFVKYIYPRFGNRSIYAIIGILSAVFGVLFISRLPIGTFSLDTWKCNDFSLETPYLIMLPVWFSCMLIGVLLKKSHHPCKSTLGSLIYLAAAAGCVLLFMALKLIMGKGILVWLEFLLPVSYVGFAYCMFKALADREALLAKWSKSILGKLTVLISMCSLEIYYVQFVWISLLKEIAFPVNFALLVIAIVLSAYILHVLSDLLLKPRRKNK